MADEPKVNFDNKREMDAAAFSQAAYVLDQARQNLDDSDGCENMGEMTKANVSVPSLAGLLWPNPSS